MARAADRPGGISAREQRRPQISNALAIATVTATLAQLVQRAAKGAVAGTNLRVGRPEVPAAGTKLLNLFLYQVSPNHALRNTDLPTRSADGTPVSRARIAVDLHYLLTFYGDDTQYEPQRMLGAVLRDLHARPVLTREQVSKAVSDAGVVLKDSDLDRAVDLVKFIPLSLSLEELSKVWSIFLQTPYALSVAYQGSVVLIESEESLIEPRPVLQRGKDDRGVETLLAPFPRLDEIAIGSLASDQARPRPPSQPAAQLGARLRLLGSGFAGDQVLVRFQRAGGAPVVLPIAAEPRSARELVVDLPNDAAAQTAWMAGLYAVNVLVRNGTAERASNTVPLALAPRVAKIEPANPIPIAPEGTKLAVTVQPEVSAAQSALLHLGDREVSAEAHLGSAAKLSFVISKAQAVTDELLRVRIDGVDSLPFRFDEQTGRFVFDDAQKVTLK